MAANFNVLTATTQDIQDGYKEGSLTAVSVLQAYLAQIDHHESYLHAIIELAPRALLMETARKLDIERKSSGIRGPLYGIPILVKYNIDTHPDLGVESTTAGTCALRVSRPRGNSPAIDRLVKAGAIILGKANMSELMWFKGNVVSGWSAARGLTQSAYVRGGYQFNDSNTGHSNTAGSSSGSATAVAAGFVPVALGTDTGGSIAFPSCRQAIFALRPTMGIISNAGVVPLTPRFDTIGPMTKCARDVAVLLDAMVDPSTTSVPAGGYISSLSSDWGGLRIGSLDPASWLLDDETVKPVKGAKEYEIRETKAAYAKLKTILGENFHDNVDFVSTTDSSTDSRGVDHFGKILYNDFRPALNKYLEGLVDSPVRTLEELIKWNSQHADQELPEGYDRQERLTEAQNFHMSPEERQESDYYIRQKCGKEGIDKTMAQYNIDVIIGPADSLLTNIGSSIGAPVATVPLGILDFNGRAFGVIALAAPHDDAKLLHFMSAWESTMPKRPVPNLSLL
ncbi:hypothetical protein VTL71DRAFT_11261 [Oculimacula yallundae]|uniref:Amidase domain-containing protein n=1 Tax=Oculimacula yallundae TaxID=86028 RepID=A0ABR4CVN4_9HELO